MDEEGSAYVDALAILLENYGFSYVKSDFISADGVSFLEALSDQLADIFVAIFIVSDSSNFSDDPILSYYSSKEGAKNIFIVVERVPESMSGHVFPKGISSAAEYTNIFWVDREWRSSHSISEEMLSGIFIDLDKWYYQKFVFQNMFSHPRSRSRSSRPLNEGKLIIVGRGEVGKTSLARRLSGFSFRGDESKTQGININEIYVEVSGTNIKLHVWDFGGQEIMHATHQFFLTERSLYLIVLNGREGGEDIDADYWLRQVESFGGRSPVIIVQNKVLQHSFELNYRGLMSRYPQIRGFIKTDCSNGLGIDSLRDAVSLALVDMPETRLKFPAAWFSIKEQIEMMNDNFIGYDGFRDLCLREGVEGEADLDTISWVLHCLGIALNYKEDSRLRETSVLKPEWVTNGIYSILNASSLASNCGELNIDELLNILPEDDYPRSKHFLCS